MKELGIQLDRER